MPNIDAVVLPDMLTEKQLVGRVVVVIDVLRASTTMVQAIEQGARCIVPVVSVDGARMIAQDRAGAILCGERGGVRPDGFTLGNSPLEYTREIIEGKECVLSTTNGTRALGLVEKAEAVLIGSMRNLDAICSWIRSSGLDAMMVCSGTDGKVSFEDCFCAGLFVDRLGFHASDGAALMYHAATHAVDRMGSERFAVESSFHAKRLIQLGFEADVAFASEMSVSSVVPILDQAVGEIHAG